MAVLADERIRETKVCVVGASGKLGQYMVQHALDRGYEVVGVCRGQSVGKLDVFNVGITVMPGATNDRNVIRKAVAGFDGVLVVLPPGAFTGARLVQLKRCWTTRRRARGSCSLAGGTSRVTVKTSTRGDSRGPQLLAVGSAESFAWSTSMTRRKRVGDALLERNVTRRVDFALFMVEALENDELIHEAPAIVGCRTPSALAHAATGGPSTDH